MKLPDILEIRPLAKPPNCTITVPGSKSITNRALILAALSDKKCTLRGALWADDPEIMVNALRELGFQIEVSSDPNEECNRTIVVEGRGGSIPATKAKLYVGNAGTAARFLTALVCLGHGEYEIYGDARMNERPMSDLFGALRALGVEISARDEKLPATIHAKGLRGGKVLVETSKSSQFASALVLLRVRAELDITVQGNIAPHDYIHMTAKMLDCVDSGEYEIEPDLSSASYFLAARFICGGEVKIAKWPKIPREEGGGLQIDGEFPKFLPTPREISRRWDLGDSVLTLAICALFGQTPMTVTDAAKLREQETDRIEAMVTELRKIGARAEKTRDSFKVFPAERSLHGADIETYNDHRMAMCFSVLGLKVPGIRIKNPSCVNKTFPNFFDKLEQLRH